MSKWTNFRDRLVAKICKALGINPAGAGEGEGREVGKRPPQEPEAAPASSSSTEPVLEFRYGGFDGSKAKEDGACQIKSVSANGKGATFKFSGSWWGSTHDNPTMRCCAFYKDGSGKWVGGFWEWGSPDRTYRAFTNIDDGYKGWNAKAFRAAKELAFMVCSKDGKNRSNIVVAKGF